MLSVTYLHGCQNLEVRREVHPLVCPVVVDHGGAPRPRTVFAQTLPHSTNDIE